MRKTNNNELTNILDKGIDDMEAGRELPAEEAFKLVNELGEKRRSDYRKISLFLEKLINIEGSYDDFVIGVLNYIKKKDSRLSVVDEYLEKHKEASTSDIIQFIITRPDFREDSAAGNKAEKNESR